jgi:hypothetical protein
MKLVKIPETSFVREISSMGLSNNDEKSKSEYEAKIQMIKLQKDELNKVKSTVNELKDDVTDLKLLILKLLDKSNG